MEKLRDLELFSLEKSSDYILNAHQYLKDRGQEGEAKFFSVVCSESTRGNGHKVEPMRFHLEQEEKLLCRGCVSPGGSLLWRDKSSEHCDSGQPAVGDPA